jgi:hypothetical protein
MPLLFNFLEINVFQDLLDLEGLFLVQRILVSQ